MSRLGWPPHNIPPKCAPAHRGEIDVQRHHQSQDHQHACAGVAGPVEGALQFVGAGIALGKFRTKVYHFGDKRGVLMALASQGYVELAGRLRLARATGSFLGVGVAYVEFALSNPVLFQVLCNPTSSTTRTLR